MRFKIISVCCEAFVLASVVCCSGREGRRVSGCPAVGRELLVAVASAG